MKQLHLNAMHRLCSRALANGAERLSAYRLRWDISGNCDNSHITEVLSRPTAEAPPTPFGDRGTGELPANRYVTIRRGGKQPLLLEIHTRCRKCEKCRRVRQALWTMRARAECSMAPRTWFGTLTLRPDEQFGALMRARARLDQQGLDYDGLPLGEQFILRHNEISSELTRYLKRVRKNSGAPLKYLLVAEQHKSGNPHYHMLVHECDALVPIRHAVLTEAWTLGFSKWKLLTNVQEGTYLCKYLSKSAVARVRASQRYGETTPPQSALSVASPMREGGDKDACKPTPKLTKLSIRTEQREGEKLAPSLSTE